MDRPFRAVNPFQPSVSFGVVNLGRRPNKTSAGPPQHGTTSSHTIRPTPSRPARTGSIDSWDGPDEEEALPSRGAGQVTKMPEPQHYTEHTASEHFEEEEPPSVLYFIFAFLFDTVPRQVYLNCLLRLPYVYFYRVTRIFEEAQLRMSEIEKMAVEASGAWKSATGWDFQPIVNSAPYENLQKSWDAFINDLLREWKTLNIVSVLLLSAILTILQIESAANDPLTRFSALVAMLASFMSLIYGCIYIIRFGSMREATKAAQWAEEAQRSRTGIFWNVWVMLSMPTVWLSWGMIAFIISIMSFVWRTGTTADVDLMSPTQALVGRIIVTVFLFFGITYFILIISTLKRYGDMLDDQWRQKVISIVETATHERSKGKFGAARRDSKISSVAPQQRGPQHVDYRPADLRPSPPMPAADASFTQLHPPSRNGDAARNWLPAANDRPTTDHGVPKRSEQRVDVPMPSVKPPPIVEENEVVSMFRLVDLSIPRSSEHSDLPSEDELARSGFSSQDEWSSFSDRLRQDVRKRANDEKFYDLKLPLPSKTTGQIRLCEEHRPGDESSTKKLAVYLFSTSAPLVDVPDDRWGQIPSQLLRLDVFIPPAASKSGHRRLVIERTWDGATVSVEEGDGIPIELSQV